MSFTYAQLSQAIQDYTEQDTTTFVNNIPTFVRFAEERILKATQLQEFQHTGSITLAADTRCVDKPCDWLANYSLTLRLDDTTDSREQLLYKDKTFLDAYWPDYASTGTPRYYSDFDVDQLVVAPTPDVEYTAILHYLRRPTSLVDAPEQTWLSTNAPQALLFAALVEAYGFLKGEQEMIAFYDGRFAESIMRMKNHGEALEVDDSLRKSFIRTQPT